MISLITANWLLYIIALFIGIATAFWAWAASDREISTADSFNAEDGLLEKAGEPVRPAEAQTEPTPPPVAAPTKPKPAPVKPAATPPATPPKPAVKAERKANTPAPTDKPNIPAAVGEPDNLRLIKGVGPKLNTLLNNLGITRFDQIAEWKEAEIIEVDKHLDTFSGRITRDAWIDQAKFLAKDDIAGFEKKYGKL